MSVRVSRQPNPTPQGQCPACGRRFTLVATGMVRRHGMGTGWGHVTCPGSGQPPQPATPQHPLRQHDRRTND